MFGGSSAKKLWRLPLPTLPLPAGRLRFLTQARVEASKVACRVSTKNSFTGWSMRACGSDGIFSIIDASYMQDF